MPRRLPEAPEGGVQAALCGKHRQGRWFESTIRHAVVLWDRLFEAGRDHGIKPMGTISLEMSRIEAGFIQAGTDFVPADQAIRPGRTRSPFELDLAWLVDFEKGAFNGRAALWKEKQNGSRYRLVKLDVEGNKPAKDAYVYDRKRKQIGTVTSSLWSPAAKANIALGTIDAAHGAPGEELYAEIYYQKELKWNRIMAKCKVVDGPFYQPERRSRTPAADF